MKKILVIDPPKLLIDDVAALRRVYGFEVSIIEMTPTQAEDAWKEKSHSEHFDLFVVSGHFLQYSGITAAMLKKTWGTENAKVVATTWAEPDLQELKRNPDINLSFEKAEFHLLHGDIKEKLIGLW